MGPNALPVPDIRKGKINSNWELTTSFDYHFFEYDNTINFSTKLNIPLAKDIVVLELYGVVVEYFRMDSILKQESTRWFLLVVSMVGVLIETPVHTVTITDKVEDVVVILVSL